MITAQERDRLSKLLGMLGSEFDGERANAAAMISRMAAAKKITIPDLCLAPVSSTASAGKSSYQSWSHDETRRQNQKTYQQRKQEKPKNDPNRPDHSDFIRSAWFIKDNYMHLISVWEQEFIKNIASKKLNWNLTEKQLPIMKRIIDKVTKAVDEGAGREDYVDTFDDCPF